MLQDLIGKKAQIIKGNLTDEFFGFDDDMSEYIGETGEIENTIGCILDDHGEVLHFEDSDEYHKEKYKQSRTLLGVHIFGCSWHIDDVKILPVTERKTKKTNQTFIFDPSNIMVAEKKRANKSSRSRVNSSLSSAKGKPKSKNTVSKRSVAKSSKRTVKVRKR